MLPASVARTLRAGEEYVNREESANALIFYDPSQGLVVAIEETSDAEFVRYRDSERYSETSRRPQAVSEAIAALGSHIKQFKVVTAR